MTVARIILWIIAGLLGIIVLGGLGIGIVMRAMPPRPLAFTGPRESQFWQSWGSVGDELRSLARSGNSSIFHERPPRPVERMLDASQPAILALQETSTRGNLHLLSRAGSKTLEASELGNADEVRAIARVLSLDSQRLIAAKRWEESANRVRAICAIAHSLAAERRPSSPLYAEYVLDLVLSNAASLLSAAPESSTACSHVLSELQGFDPEDPVQWADGLRSAIEIIRDSAHQIAYEEAIEKRNQGLYTRPSDGQPPSDDELREFTLRVSEEKFALAMAFARDITRAWESESRFPNTRISVQRAIDGEFGTRAQPLATSMQKPLDSYESFCIRWRQTLQAIESAVHKLE